MFGNKDVLTTRLQSEVDYLREQNKMLMDRLLLLTDRPAYKEQKAFEAQERAQMVELEKYKNMTPDQIESRQKQEAEKETVKNTLLRQIMTGGE